jgi:hypothetical protein
MARGFHFVSAVLAVWKLPEYSEGRTLICGSRIPPSACICVSCADATMVERRKDYMDDGD